VTSFQILQLHFCINFFSSSCPDSSVGIPVGETVFFLLENVRPGSWAHPASYSMDTGEEHSGREVYQSSPTSAQVVNEWSCISTSSVCLHGVDRAFFTSFTCALHARAYHVMRLLYSVKLPSFKFLPSVNSRDHTFSRHTTLLSSPPSLLARPTMLHLFIVITMEDTFKFHT